jgi:hypothetical protein
MKLNDTMNCNSCIIRRKTDFDHSFEGEKQGWGGSDEGDNYFQK